MVVNRSCLVVKMKLLQKPGMMTLVALGISVAYIYSLYAFYMNNFSSATGHTMDFWELATLILIMLLGHWIEMNLSEIWRCFKENGRTVT